MPIIVSPKETDHDFQQKVKEISGQIFQKCFQCGTCSGSCPMNDQITVLPRRIMAFLQLGKKETLEQADTPWVCLSCHTCTVRCPRGIDIAKVMEALRLTVLRQNIDRIHPNKLEPCQISEMPQIAMVSGFRKLTS